MTVQSHFARLENTLHSRGDLIILYTRIRPVKETTIFAARVGFIDGSTLNIVEQVIPAGEWDFRRLVYSFHYQRADGALIFRYDNSPHFPDLPTFPAHKHTPDGVIASPIPDLAEVLREIDSLLYPG